MTVPTIINYVGYCEDAWLLLRLRNISSALSEKGSDGFEVDYYVPEKKWAIEVSFSLNDEETRKHEVGALSKLPRVVECERRTIFTFDGEKTIED